MGKPKMGSVPVYNNFYMRTTKRGIHEKNFPYIHKLKGEVEIKNALRSIRGMMGENLHLETRKFLRAVKMGKPKMGSVPVYTNTGKVSLKIPVFAVSCIYGDKNFFPYSC